MIDPTIATWIVAILGHSLWQGVVAMAGAVVLTQLLPARWRHLGSQAACLALLGAVVATAFLLRPVDVEVAVLPLPAAALPAVAAAATTTVSAPITPMALSDAATPWQAWVACGWLAGMALVALWHVGGWWRLVRIRAAGLPLPIEVAVLADACLERCRLAGRVAVRMTRRLAVPTVIGWWRPVILIPAALTGLAPEQLEALILHELAHVRRRDWLLNIALCAIEALLFFHPAVWWLGRRIRAERETACDAIAVRHGADPVAFARALLALAESVQPGRPALAATGGDLTERVRCLLGGTRHRQRLPAVIAGMVIALLVVAACARTSTAGMDEGALPIGPITVDQGPTDDRVPGRADAQVRVSTRIVMMPKAQRRQLGLPKPGTACTIDAANRERLLERLKTLPDVEVSKELEMMGFHSQLCHSAYVREKPYRTDIIDGHAIMTVVRTGKTCEVRGEAHSTGAILDHFAWKETEVVDVRRFSIQELPARTLHTIEEPVVRTQLLTSPARVHLGAGESLIIVASPPTYEEVTSPAITRMIPEIGLSKTYSKDALWDSIDDTFDRIIIVTLEVSQRSMADHQPDAPWTNDPAPLLGRLPAVASAHVVGIDEEPWKQRLQAKLEQVIDVAYEQWPLDDVFTSLVAKSDVGMSSPLAITRGKTITLTASSIRLRDVLDRIMAQTGLSYELVREVIRITGPASAALPTGTHARQPGSVD